MEFFLINQKKIGKQKHLTKALECKNNFECHVCETVP